MGLWHGASWTFVLWGLYHSAWIFFFRIINKVRLIRVFLGSNLRGFLITLPIMMLGWIPFRAESLETTFSMWAKVIDFSAYGFLSMRENAYLVAAMLLTGFIFTSFIFSNSYSFLSSKPGLQRILEIIFLCTIIPFILIFLRPISQFIYFQF